MSYTSKINELQQRLKTVLNNVDSSQLNNMIVIKNELIILKNEIEEELKISYDDINKLIRRINDKEKINVQLQKKVDGLKDENAGSIQLYEDIQLLYNQRLIGNWILVFVISSGVYLFMKKKI
tara:strand:+ start:16534 stop:16902 length:369 start_codon:yes stop_codon:yes gene_type:complete